MRRFLILVLTLVMAIGLPLAGTATAASNACPHADNTPPNCGKGKGGTTCGPQTQGGTRPTTMVGGAVWDVGAGFTANNAAQVGDLVQTVACLIPI
jgi:hypothetical protein